MITSIYSDNAPQAVGPYSQAIKANGFIFCSGQIGIHPGSGDLVEGLENQTRQIFKNLQEILSSSGANTQTVIKTTVFLKNMKDYSKMNLIYAEFFGNHKPARSTIEVAYLPKDALIEIELIALEK